MSNLIIDTTKYVGIPFRHKGRNPNTGLDCLGLVKSIAEDNGINTSGYEGDYVQTWYTLNDRQKHITELTDGFGKATVPSNPDNLEYGDLILFKTCKNEPVHIGVYIGNNQFLHCMKKCGVSMSRLTHHWRNRIWKAGKLITEKDIQNAGADWWAVISAILSVASIIAGFLIKPKTSDSSEAESVYGFAGAKTTAKANVPMPIIYGRMKVGGILTNAYVHTEASNSEWLNMLISISEGITWGVPSPVKDNVWIGESTLNDFGDDVAYSIQTSGNADQQAISLGGANRFLEFSQVHEIIEIGSGGVELKELNDEHSQQTSENVDSVELHFTFPNGIYKFSSNDGYSHNTSNYKIQYSLDDVTYTDVMNIRVRANTSTQYFYAVLIDFVKTYDPTTTDYDGVPFAKFTNGSNTIEWQTPTSPYGGLGLPYYLMANIDGDAEYLVVGDSISSRDTTEFEPYGTIWAEFTDGSNLVKGYTLSSGSIQAKLRYSDGGSPTYFQVGQEIRINSSSEEWYRIVSVSADNYSITLDRAYIGLASGISVRYNSWRIRNAQDHTWYKILSIAGDNKSVVIDGSYAGNTVTTRSWQIRRATGNAIGLGLDRNQYYLKVIRLSDESTQEAQSDLRWDYIDEIEDFALGYPNTAQIGVAIKATDKVSGSISNTTALYDGIRVPDVRAMVSGTATSVSYTATSRKLVTSIARVSDVMTVTTSAAHGFSTGDIVMITGVQETQDSFNTKYPWSITVTSPVTFTLQMTVDAPDDTATVADPIIGVITTQRWGYLTLSGVTPFSGSIQGDYISINNERWYQAYRRIDTNKVVLTEEYTGTTGSSLNYRYIPKMTTASFDDGSYNNTSCCVFDLLVNKRYGLGNYVDTSRIDIESFQSWADYCDSTFNYTDSEGNIQSIPIGRLNGVIDTNHNPVDIIDQMCQTGDGFLVWQDGYLRIVIDQIASPVATFDDLADGNNNILEDSVNITFTNIEDVPTIVEAEILDEDNDYNQETVVISLESVWTGTDARKVRKINLFGITNKARAIRKAQRILNYGRFSNLLVTFQSTIQTIAIEAGDVVNLTYSEAGWVNKKFRVVKMDLSDDFTRQSITLSEYDDSIYTSVPIVLSDDYYTILPDPDQIPLNVTDVALTELPVSKQIQIEYAIPLSFTMVTVGANQSLSNANWHHADIYVSTNGLDYKFLTQDNTGRTHIEDYISGIRYWVKIYSVSATGVSNPNPIITTIVTRGLGYDLPAKPTGLRMYRNSTEDTYTSGTLSLEWRKTSPIRGAGSVKAGYDETGAGDYQDSDWQDFQMEIIEYTNNVLLISSVLSSPQYTLSASAYKEALISTGLSSNTAPNLLVKVYNRDKYNRLSNPAKMLFKNPEPVKPTGLTGSMAYFIVTPPYTIRLFTSLYWNANTEPDLSHYIIKFRFNSAGLWADAYSQHITYNNSHSSQLTVELPNPLGTSQMELFIIAVDTFGTQSIDSDISIINFVPITI